MKRILLFNNDAWTTWKHRRGIIRFLEQNGLEVIVLAGEENKYSSFLHSNFNFIPITNMNTTGINPFEERKLYKEVASVYHKVRPDIVMHYTMKPNIYGGMICGKMGIPYISTINGLGRTFLKKGISSRIMISLLKKGLKNAEKVFFQNNDDLQLFESIGVLSSHKAVRVKGSGVNLNEWDGHMTFRPPTERHFLFAARLIPEKGVMEFIEIAKLLKPLYPKSVFRIVGPVVDSRITVSLLRTYDQQGLISFGGETDDMKTEFSHCDVVVLPTYYREGIPKVLIEALASGKPIITTDFTGARETIDSGKNGILIAPQNIHDLREAVEKVNSLDSSILAEMGRNSRILAEKEFDENMVYEKYLQTIRSIACS